MTDCFWEGDLGEPSWKILLYLLKFLTCNCINNSKNEKIKNRIYTKKMWQDTNAVGKNLKIKIFKNN